MAKISDLHFDDKNFNKHTEFGMGLLEKSLRENGAGRSILIDKDNNIIAGNGIVEAAGQVGLEKIKVVETTGDEIVAVKRTDLSLNSEQGRTMALADNATANADLEWDTDALADVFEPEDLEKWGVDIEFPEPEAEVEEDEIPEADESTDTKVGDVFILGSHRVMCGDSTDPASVEKLMGGGRS